MYRTRIESRRGDLATVRTSISSEREINKTKRVRDRTDLEGVTEEDDEEEEVVMNVRKARHFSMPSAA